MHKEDYKEDLKIIFKWNILWQKICMNNQQLIDYNLVREICLKIISISTVEIWKIIIKMQSIRLIMTLKFSPIFKNLRVDPYHTLFDLTLNIFFFINFLSSLIYFSNLN